MEVVFIDSVQLRGQQMYLDQDLKSVLTEDLVVFSVPPGHRSFPSTFQFIFLRTSDHSTLILNYCQLVKGTIKKM
jgi:hypothetical protein